MNQSAKILSIMLSLMLSSTSVIAYSENINESFDGRSTIMKSFQKKQQPSLSKETIEILKQNKLSPNIASLLEQVKKNNYNNVKLLLEIGVDPNQNYITEYPIYIASRNNNIEMVKLLLDHGAKLNKSFDSELYQAVKNKNLELIDLLIENNAKTDYSDAFSGKTILYQALKNNLKDVAVKLYKNGARIDQYSYRLIKSKKLEYLFMNPS